MRIGAFQLNETARKRILRVSASLLAVLLAAFCIYHFSSDMNRGIETMLVTEDLIEQSVRGEAVVFRTESPIASTYAGLTVPLVASGAHVPKDFEIARVYDGGAEYRETYRALSTQIEALTAAMAAGDTLADLSALREELHALSLRVVERMENGNATDARPLLSDLQLLSCRVEALTEADFSISELVSALTEERDALVSRAGQASETLRSPGSGYYYPDADGFHTLCSAERIATLTPAELSDAVDTLRASDGTASGVGTMVYSAEWYIAVQLDLTAEELERYTVGETYPVIFLGESEERIPMTLVRTAEGSGEECDMLILSTLRMPKGFSFQRLSDVRIVTGEVGGYTVPKSAVRTLNGITGVYVLDGSEVKFSRIEILCELASRYIVKATDPMPSGEYTENTYRYVALYDAMILSDRALSHGQLLS